jgi:hypothetical protein
MFERTSIALVSVGGLGSVSTEINLTVLAYNLKRVCNLLGVQNLIAALS